MFYLGLRCILSQFAYTQYAASLQQVALRNEVLIVTENGTVPSRSTCRHCGFLALNATLQQSAADYAWRTRSVRHPSQNPALEGHLGRVEQDQSLG